MDDCIYREAAIGKANKFAYIYHANRHEETAEAFLMFVQELKFLPSADVKPVVHGKWLLKDRHDSWTYWTCSECGRFVYLTDYKENVQEEYPFCHCGADMQESED